MLVSFLCLEKERSDICGSGFPIGVRPDEKGNFRLPDAFFILPVMHRWENTTCDYVSRKEPKWKTYSTAAAIDIRGHCKISSAVKRNISLRQRMQGTIEEGRTKKNWPSGVFAITWFRSLQNSRELKLYELQRRPPRPPSASSSSDEASNIFLQRMCEEGRRKAVAKKGSFVNTSL